MADPPAHRRVAAAIRAQIRAGHLPPGAKLPTEHQMVDTYGISRGTARRVFATLAAEGLVVARRPHGTFVADPIEVVRLAAGRYRRGHHPVRAEADINGATVALDTVPDIAASTPAPPDVARRLHITPGDPVSRVTYRWLAEGELYQVSTQWEPLHITAGTPVERPAATIDDPDVIARMDTIGWYVTHVDESIRARPAAADNPLGIPAGMPLFNITRTHWAGDTPVETADIVIRADRIVIENRNDVPTEGDPPMPDPTPPTPGNPR